MKELTRKQAVIFQWIKSYIASAGFAPSIREVADFFQMSIRGAYDHIKALEKKGYVTHLPKTARTLRITYHENGMKQDIVISAEHPFEIVYENIESV